jgi:PIN domain nuclease of toxin-antitoxin system
VRYSSGLLKFESGSDWLVVSAELLWRALIGRFACPSPPASQTSKRSCCGRSYPERIVPIHALIDANLKLSDITIVEGKHLRAKEHLRLPRSFTLNLQDRKKHTNFKHHPTKEATKLTETPTKFAHRQPWDTAVRFALTTMTSFRSPVEQGIVHMVCAMNV